MLIKYNCLYFFFLAQFGFFLFELSNTVCFSFLYPLCNILHVNNNNTFFFFSFLSRFFSVILFSHRYWGFSFLVPLFSLFNQGLHILFHLFSHFRRIGAYPVRCPLDPAVEKHPTLGSAEVETVEMIDGYDEAVVVSTNSEPFFVRRLLKEALGNDINDLKLLVFTVHRVVLEYGFVRIDKDSSTAISCFHSLDDSPSPFSSMKSLRYTLPQILVDGGSHSVNLKFQTLGHFVNVCGGCPMILVRGCTMFVGIKLNMLYEKIVCKKMVRRKKKFLFAYVYIYITLCI